MSQKQYRNIYILVIPQMFIFKIQNNNIQKLYFINCIEEDQIIFWSIIGFKIGFKQTSLLF